MTDPEKSGELRLKSEQLAVAFVSKIDLNKSDEPYLRPEQLAELLNVKTSTVINWARAYSDFPHLVLPGSIRIRLSEVSSWLERFQRHPVPPETEPQNPQN
jgi:hypothetical protein